jgi:glutathione S-transferase
MSLVLYSHPLASFCQKALTGLYELGVPFTQRVIDLGNPAERDELAQLWREQADGQDRSIRRAAPSCRVLRARA